jgi:hypothetical protein
MSGKKKDLANQEVGSQEAISLEQNITSARWNPLSYNLISIVLHGRAGSG